MTDKEAYAQGLQYTGMSWDGWNREKAEKYKAQVDAIKKKYKVRVVKVRDTGCSGWYSYYGDRNFCLVQYDDIDKLQQRLDYIPSQIEAAKKEYEEKLAEIAKKQQEIINKMHKIKEIMK